MSLLIALLLFIVTILLLFLYGKWKLNYWSRKNVPQLTPSLLFGNYKPVVFATKSFQNFFLDIYKEAKSKGYKHVGIYNLWMPEYVPLDLQVAKRILIKDFAHFDGHGVYSNKNDLLSEHLFSLDGAEWKERRVKMTPTFTTGKMKMMFETLIGKAQTLETILNQVANTTNEIVVKDLMARFSTDIIASIAFGLDCETLKNPEHKFREIGREAFKPKFYNFILENMVNPVVLGILGYRKQPKSVQEYFAKIVEETIKFREKSNIQRKDFMHFLLQLKNNNSVESKEKTVFTDRDAINEAFLFYLAGFETSSTTMTYALTELAQQPAVQDKLREEIKTTLEKYDGKVTYEALLEMEYLEKVIKETLRLYPVLATLQRYCNKTYQVPETDLIIQKGTVVHVPIIGYQRDPEYYPNPDKFNPDNFDAKNQENRPDFTWMPFGEGPRQCLGMRFGLMQTKLGIVTVIRNFKLTLNKKIRLPFKFVPSSIVFVTDQEIVLDIKKIE